MGRLLQTLKCCCFDRGEKTALREFSNRNDLEWESYLYDICYFIVSLIITLTFHFVFNPKWIVEKARKKQTNKKKTGNIEYFSTLSWPYAIYKCFVYFIFSILSSSHTGAMFFIGVIQSKAPRVRRFESRLWFEILLPSRKCKVLFYTVVCKWQRCNFLWEQKFRCRQWLLRFLLQKI